MWEKGHKGIDGQWSRRLYVRKGYAYCQKCGKQHPDTELIVVVDPEIGYKRICKDCFRNGKDPNFNSALC